MDDCKFVEHGAAARGDTCRTSLNSSMMLVTGRLRGLLTCTKMEPNFLTALARDRSCLLGTPGSCNTWTHAHIADTAGCNFVATQAGSYRVHCQRQHDTSDETNSTAQHSTAQHSITGKMDTLKFRFCPETQVKFASLTSPHLAVHSCRP